MACSTIPTVVQKSEVQIDKFSTSLRSRGLWRTVFASDPPDVGMAQIVEPPVTFILCDTHHLSSFEDIDDNNNNNKNDNNHNSKKSGWSPLRRRTKKGTLGLRQVS